jgi:23S rRNA pseudouridine2605 synthase
MHLNCYLSQAGISSRRKSVDLIKQGLVSVNDKIVRAPWFDVSPSDIVVCNGERLHIEKKIYIVLNKPAGCVTTLSDELGRKTVIDIIGDAITQRIYPVGRLDADTTGVLILTNDGEFAQQTVHPSHNIEKSYQVTLHRPLDARDENKLLKGITLKDGVMFVDAIRVHEGKNIVDVSIHSGRNRIVRRLFAAIGYEVLALQRTLFGCIAIDELAEGQWRYLTDQEIACMIKK